MSEQGVELTAEQKADAAVEALAAEGEKVVARSVRERAGVRMLVATQAVQRWRAREAAAVAVPPVPDVLATRFEAVWREAFAAARGLFDAERAGWMQRVEDAHAQVAAASDEAEAALTRAEAERVAALGYAEQVKTLTAELKALSAALESEREASRAAERALAQAQAQVSAAEGRVAGLREALSSLHAEPADGSA